MAVDTADKRSSAIGATRPWVYRLPMPDGIIDAANRACAAYIYCGLITHDMIPATQHYELRGWVDAYPEIRGWVDSYPELRGQDSA